MEISLELWPGTRPRQWSNTAAVLAVAACAALLRLWALGSLPLIITNDGTEYLSHGMRLASGEGLSIIRPVRTPGYPLLLGGIFRAFGTGPVAVLLCQHLMGVVACSLVAYMGGRLTRPLVGCLAGLLLALDPWLFALECYALSETLTVLLLVCAVALTLGPARPRTYQAFLTGVALGAACLARPACQVFLPFVGLAWLVRAHPVGGWRRLLVAGLVGAAGLAMVLGPWMLFNRSRHVDGVASGYGLEQFQGLLRFGLVDRDFPRDPELADAFADLGTRTPSWPQVRRFISQHVGPWCDRGGNLSAWNRASIVAHFREYLRCCRYALAWQLNWFPKQGPESRRYSWSDWSLQRLADDGSNRQYKSDSSDDGLAVFAMTSQGGGLRPILGWLGVHSGGGVPQMALFACALATAVITIFRRQWSLALVVIGSFAFLLAHVALLSPVGRYAVPVMPLWYLCVPFAAQAAGDRIGQGFSRVTKSTKAQCRR